MARKGKGKPAGPKLNAAKEANAKPEASDQVKKDDSKLKEENPSVISGPEDKMEEDKKEKTNTETNNANNTPKKKKRLRKKKKAAPGGEASAAKASDKPATSASAEKGSKKADSMGLIFMCNSKTKKDCYQYKVLGLPASKKDQVAKVYKGMRLFLFDVDLRLMYGVYKAAAPGGFNIEPKAFKSAFPSQVRFDVLDDCLPLPEEKFKVAIKENYYGKNKFNCQLTSQQVKDLCKLFRTSSEGKVKPKQGGKLGPSKSVSRGFADRSGRKRQVRPLLVAGGPLPRPAPPIYEREPIYTRESVYEREPYPAPLPPNYVYERPLDADYYRRDPPRVLGLRDRDPAEYRDPYSYRGTVPYDGLYAAPALHAPALHAAPALPVYPRPPLYRY